MAQSSTFKPGSYILNKEQTVRHNGELKLRDGNTLAVKNAQGKTLKLTPDDVHAFSIGRRKYTVAKGFLVNLGSSYVDKAFVEQVDSGIVVLLNYTYAVSSPGHMTAGGGMVGGGTSSKPEYLIRWAKDSTLTALTTGGWNGGPYFREMLRPFLVSRPDLVKLVDEKIATPETLIPVILSLNRNLPCPLSSIGTSSGKQD
ncbi:hypothetical protein [Solirubrum puertoriconensis]|uniref:Uncharacterized protein n=1 Tax=Solirubrum puertoriconensis TaxID=1751427 RepID=A0A9X0HLX7_SOLP1|nr:hypothetical protein [Solirubrum puertoriconensis]KUG08291.1 hypothetical protein ASU33_08940 [Solirubrum puertoriconensis]